MTSVRQRPRKGQERGLRKATTPRDQHSLRRILAQPNDYDAEWKDEEDNIDEDEGYDSGLGSSSGSDRSELQHLERHKRHLRMSRRLILRHSSVVDILGGKGDPFGALPDTIGGGDMLVHYWNNVIAHSGVAGPRKDWFPFALQHPTLFQATLFVAASSFDTVNGRRMPTLFLSHRGEIIRTISSRLADPDLAATDSSIGAVAMIYMVDSMRSTKDVAHAHLSGLKQLIAARGGLGLVDPRVQTMIKLVDLLGSTYLREPPHFHDSRFENVLPSHLYGQPSVSTVQYAAAFAARLTAFAEDKDVADACADIYWGLRNLTVIYESSRNKWHEGPDFSTRAEYLERQLRKLLDDLEANSHTESSTPEHADEGSKGGQNDKPKSGGATGTGALKYSHGLVFKVFGLASRIYILMTLQQMDPKLPVFPLLARMLEEVFTGMGDAKLKTILGTFPDLMIWVLFLGGLAAPWGRKGFFAKTATRVLLVKKVEEKPGVENAKDAFLWPEGKQNYDPSIDMDLVVDAQDS